MEEIDRDLLTKLLSKLPKLQSLKLMNYQSDIDVDKISKMLPDLKSLNLKESTSVVAKDLINAIAARLEYSSFYQNEDIDYRFHLVNFKQLLCLHGMLMTTKCVNDILKTAINLKKFIIHTLPSMTSSELENIMIKVFNSCKSLDYVEFICTADTHDGVEIALGGIEKGLFQTQNREREYMKIMIRPTYNDTKEAQKLTSNIGRIIHCLQISKINDFMFIWDMLDDAETDKDLILNDIKIVTSGIIAKLTSSYNKLIITNENCKINGYHEPLPDDFDYEIKS